MGVTVVGNPAATVKTSSPSFKARLPSEGLVKVVSAIRFAEEPEFTINACRIPTVLVNLDSNSSVYGPEVNQKSKLAFTAAFNSGAPKTFPVTGITDSPATKVFLG